MIGKVTVKAIHESDLVRVLKRLNLYEGVVEGRYKCFACGKEITLESMGGLFKGKDGNINFVCDDVKCLVTAAEITSKMIRW